MDASTVINLRAPASQRDLIDRAARLQGKTRTEFVLEASRERAEQVLLDQTLFRATPAQRKAFEAVLRRPVGDNAAIRRLLGRSAPWDT